MRHREPCSISACGLPGTRVLPLSVWTYSLKLELITHSCREALAEGLAEDQLFQRDVLRFALRLGSILSPLRCRMRGTSIPTARGFERPDSLAPSPGKIDCAALERIMLYSRAIRESTYGACSSSACSSRIFSSASPVCRRAEAACGLREKGLVAGC